MPKLAAFRASLGSGDEEDPMSKSMLLAAAAALATASAASAERADVVPARAAEAEVAAPALAVVVDPDARTAVVVPLNPRSDTPPEVTATLAGLYATGKVKPGQIVQIVVRRGNNVTEVISNAPIPGRLP
jgi:hypothetical protein